MRFLATWWSPLFVLILLARQGLQYGQRWEFGSNGLPRSLLISDGVTLSYADGTPVNPINAWLIRSQREEEVILALLLIIVMTFGMMVWIVWDTARQRRQLQKSLERLAVENRKRRSHVAKLDQE